MDKFVIIAAISIPFLCLFLVFTDPPDTAATDIIIGSREVPESAVVQDRYFVVIEQWREDGLKYSILYASDTKVMYLMADGPNRFSITELYNEDGSIQIYE